MIFILEFFLLDEQIKQNTLLQDELERNYRQITAYVENGIANQADLDAVKVEQLNTKQKRVDLVSSRAAYLKMLSLLVGEALSPETGAGETCTSKYGFGCQ